jgi:hypothetical protein
MPTGQLRILASIALEPLYNEIAVLAIDEAARKSGQI